MATKKFYNDYLEAQKPEVLVLTDEDKKRMTHMGERYKAQFQSVKGVTYYRFFYTLEEFVLFIKMCRKFKSALVAYGTTADINPEPEV